MSTSARKFTLISAATYLATENRWTCWHEFTELFGKWTEWQIYRRVGLDAPNTDAGTAHG